MLQFGSPAPILPQGVRGPSTEFSFALAAGTIRCRHDRERLSDLFLALYAAGWSIGDAQFSEPDGAVWFVSGTKGEAIIKATGKTQGEAWRRAADQAKAYGMLGCVSRGVGRF